jgi:hypothetical protein
MTPHPTREALDRLAVLLAEPRTLSQFAGPHDLACALLVERDAVAALLPALLAMAADAEKWRFVRDLPCNHLYLTRNDEHAPNYMTAAAWIEESGHDFDDTPADELERMKATNTIWNFQVYPNTPVGFNRWYGATADAAIDACMADTARQGAARGEGVGGG